MQINSLVIEGISNERNFLAVCLYLAGKNICFALFELKFCFLHGPFLKSDAFKRF